MERGILIKENGSLRRSAGGESMAIDYAVLEQELETYLAQRNSEIIKRYDDYRNLLRKIHLELELSPVDLSLFPERSTGIAFKRELFKRQGKSYDGKPVTKLPPWSRKEEESWIKAEALINRLLIPAKGQIQFNYEYQDPKGQLYAHEYAIEMDPMHAPVWRWSVSEIETHFGKGKRIPCVIGRDNFAQHRIWEPY